jgi:transposase
MKFYTQQHAYYCGIDLHARSMYICILDSKGNVVFHKDVKTTPEELQKAIAPFQDNIVIGVECMFAWYWISDFCQDNNIAFVLGHALYMKAIHGGKAKNDRIDSHKIASLIRGGTFPMAYVYPKQKRATRDLLRRRMHLMRKRAELLAHIHNTNTQYNYPQIGKNLRYKSNRILVDKRFTDPSVQRSVDMDISLINFYDTQLSSVECYIRKHAKDHDYYSYMLLNSVPGIGDIIGLVILYEIDDINRFKTVQDFASYARLVKCKAESAGKSYGSSGSKIGNAHLKWAFSEAAVIFLRANPTAKHYVDRLTKRHGKAKALSILAHKLGRAVYFILKRKQPYDKERFFSSIDRAATARRLTGATHAKTEDHDNENVIHCSMTA